MLIDSLRELGLFSLVREETEQWLEGMGPSSKEGE